MNSINPRQASAGDLFFKALARDLQQPTITNCLLLELFTFSKKIFQNEGYFLATLVPVLITDL